MTLERYTLLISHFFLSYMLEGQLQKIKCKYFYLSNLRIYMNVALEISSYLIQAWNQYQKEGWNKNISRLLVDHQSVLQPITKFYKILADFQHWFQ